MSFPFGIRHSRWRTWIRARTPAALYDRGIVIPKARSCGAHDWYNAGDEGEHCYHCQAVRPRVAAIDTQEWCRWYKRRGAGRLRHILMQTWDPIGVSGWPSARDEYDNYVPGVAEKLHTQAEVSDLADFLESIRTKTMGLQIDRSADMATAGRLSAWYTKEMSSRRDMTSTTNRGQ
jgi:hypothetical protein